MERAPEGFLSLPPEKAEKTPRRTGPAAGRPGLGGSGAISLKRGGQRPSGLKRLSTTPPLENQHFFGSGKPNGGSGCAQGASPADAARGALPEKAAPPALKADGGKPPSRENGAGAENPSSFRPSRKIRRSAEPQAKGGRSLSPPRRRSLAAAREKKSRSPAGFPGAFSVCRRATGDGKRGASPRSPAEAITARRRA